ncbi:cache domain-containing sensor histidine kinase [Paenibacillus periandrae]|uniref:cache domain-containing sensor histidine kinase n=1 Tax=Paenibacillus periandrae TaxID=1761741 RepID=UPI001F097AD3|nr:sensor histidine kinase [Paenibacillus periandrae]
MRKTTRTFFIRNLSTFLIPMLIPIVILGTLSSVLIQQFVKNEINNTNVNLLRQSKENIELLFNEQESLNLHIVASAIEFINLKSMLEKEFPDKEDYRRLASLKNFIDSPAIGRPYIDSIYIYLNNSKNRFISSTTGGLIDLSDYYDPSWYQSFRNHPKEDMWTENRMIKKMNTKNVPIDTELITLYRRTSVSDESDGLIVLNIKPEYIKQRLESLSTQDGQLLMILNPKNEILIKNKNPSYLTMMDLQGISTRSESLFDLSINGQSFVINKLYSEKYQWTFVSAVPKASLYEVPNRLNLITLTLLLLSFLGGTIFAYYLTQRNYQDLKTIVSILDSAKHGQPLPRLPIQGKSVYSYIMHSLLQNFIEQNYMRVQLSERKYKAQAIEFAALQSQLNPHFLYNTLDTLNWKAASLTGRPNELNTIIENLSDILRYSLDGSSGLVTLKLEIANTLSYIQIQKVRYKEKFHVIWDYEPELEKYNMLKLVFQPLIENSLYHGITEKEGPCVIKIRIHTDQSRLYIAVIDNGIGILPERLARLRSQLESSQLDQSLHIGLFNTQKRLKLTYGEKSGIRMRSKFGWGTAIYITIPIN